MDILYAYNGYIYITVSKDKKWKSVKNLVYVRLVATDFEPFDLVVPCFLG